MPCFGQIELCLDTLRVVIGDVIRQLFGLDLVRTLKGDGSLDRVF